MKVRAHRAGQVTRSRAFLVSMTMPAGSDTGTQSRRTHRHCASPSPMLRQPSIPRREARSVSPRQATATARSTSTFWRSWFFIIPRQGFGGPGGVAAAHIHVGFEVILYIIQGNVRHEFGYGLKQILENEAGDFIYIKPGVPHEVFNMSETEPVVAFVARSSAAEWDDIIPYDRQQTKQDLQD